MANITVQSLFDYDVNVLVVVVCVEVDRMSCVIVSVVRVTHVVVMLS